VLWGLETVRFRAVFLKPKGAFREVPHANTLFGAIANAISLLQGSEALEEFVEAFKGEARISSAFPYTKKTLYLPKPLTIEFMVFEDLTVMKRIKKARYLDIENFERALRLEPFEVPEGEPYAARSVPKVALDRVTEKSSLYFWDEVRFRDDAGLYFLYHGPEDVYRKFIKPAVRLLGDTGIGGKSTWGLGLFEPSFGQVEIETPESPYGVTLSNALPTKNPLLWTLLRKGGWSFGRRKPKVTFIAEGSVVEDDPGRVESLDLGLPFPVYIYGRTFPVPTTVPEGLP